MPHIELTVNKSSETTRFASFFIRQVIKDIFLLNINFSNCKLLISIFLATALPVFFGSLKQKSEIPSVFTGPASTFSFVTSYTMGCKDKIQYLIGQVSKGECGAKMFLKVKWKI